VFDAAGCTQLDRGCLHPGGVRGGEAAGGHRC